MLDFSHAELTDAEQAGTRRDLIAEAQADLSGGEGHAAWWEGREGGREGGLVVVSPMQEFQKWKEERRA